MGQQGAMSLSLTKKSVSVEVHGKNECTSVLINELCNHFPNEFFFWIASFKSYLIQLSVHFVNYGSI